MYRPTFEYVQNIKHFSPGCLMGGEGSITPVWFPQRAGYTWLSFQLWTSTQQDGKQIILLKHKFI